MSACLWDKEIIQRFHRVFSPTQLHDETAELNQRPSTTYCELLDSASHDTARTMQRVMGDKASSPLSSIDEQLKQSSSRVIQRSSAALRDETLANASSPAADEMQSLSGGNPTHNGDGELGDHEGQGRQAPVNEEPHGRSQDIMGGDMTEAQDERSGKRSQLSSGPTNTGTSTLGNEVIMQAAEPVPESKTRRTGQRRAPAKRSTAKRQPKKSRWDAETISTDPKSPLATADLRVNHSP
jgi:hypothetical protein